MALAEADARRRRTDVLIAIFTAIVSIGLVIGLPPLDTADLDGPGSGSSTIYPAVASLPWTLLVVALLAQSAVLVAARRAPRAALVTTAAIAAAAALAPSTLYGLVALPVVVAVVLVGLRVQLSRLWSALVAAAVFIAVGAAADDAVVSGSFRDGWERGLPASGGHGVLQALSTIALPLLIVLVVRSRRDVRAARTAEASAVDRESDARLEAAISRERTAMARELHDIAAHHLSGIALMSAVIDRQIDSDPERAHEGVRQVRAESTAVLDDLRRLVGLLRDDGPAERSVETVAGIVDLVERTRYRHPIDLDLQVSDEHPLAVDIGPLAQLAAYRTVQESLANASMHAPGAQCTVRIDDRAPDHLVVRVENGLPTMSSSGGSVTTPTAAGSGTAGGGTAGGIAGGGTAGGGIAGGNGIRGMRERADLVGADLVAGPRDDGGWSVVLTVRREDRVVPGALETAAEVAHEAPLDRDERS